MAWHGKALRQNQRANVTNSCTRLVRACFTFSKCYAIFFLIHSHGKCSKLNRQRCFNVALLTACPYRDFQDFLRCTCTCDHFMSDKREKERNTHFVLCIFSTLMVFFVIHLQYGYRPYELRDSTFVLSKTNGRRNFLTETAHRSLDMCVILRLPDSIKQNKTKENGWISVFDRIICLFALVPIKCFTILCFSFNFGVIFWPLCYCI